MLSAHLKDATAALKAEHTVRNGEYPNCRRGHYLSIHSEKGCNYKSQGLHLLSWLAW